MGNMVMIGLVMMAVYLALFMALAWVAISDSLRARKNRKDMREAAKMLWPVLLQLLAPKQETPEWLYESLEDINGRLMDLEMAARVVGPEMTGGDTDAEADHPE